MGDLDEALMLRPTDDGHWVAKPDLRYQSLNAVFGGWTAAVALRGVTDSAEGPAAPSAITVNFVNKIQPEAEVLIRVEEVGGSKSIRHWRADLASSSGQPLAQAMVVLADRHDSDGVTQPTCPTVPDPESLELFHPPGSLGERVIHRPISGYPPFGQQNTSSNAWVRDISGRAVDHTQLTFLSDAVAPRPFFWSVGPRPTATITLSVYFHATDDEMVAIGDDYILMEVEGTRGANSISGQQVRMWSRHADLLATSEQLCWFR
jgi:acyl-CoA thioesterase